MAQTSWPVLSSSILEAHSGRLPPSRWNCSDLCLTWTLPLLTHPPCPSYTDPCKDLAHLGSHDYLPFSRPLTHHICKDYLSVLGHTVSFEAQGVDILGALNSADHTACNESGSPCPARFSYREVSSWEELCPAHLHTFAALPWS